MRNQVELRKMREDIIKVVIEDKRSKYTQEAYKKDIIRFFTWMLGMRFTNGQVLDFLNLKQGEASYLIRKYKAHLRDRGLKEATINRSMASLKALVKIAFRIGLTKIDYSNLVDAEKLTPYRDTRGVSVGEMRKIFSLPDKKTTKGRRDYAILRLLWDLGLRRGEIISLNVDDFDQERKTLAINGKCNGTEKEVLNLPHAALKALSKYLECREMRSPMFLSEAHFLKTPKRLSAAGMYLMVRGYAREAGIKRQFSPHRIRHSAITQALDQGISVREVQSFSRHKDVRTLSIYDDRRKDFQGKVSKALAGMV